MSLLNIFGDLESVLAFAQLTMSLLCIVCGLALFALFKEIKRLKEAIAILCAADPKLTAKVNKLLKPIMEEKDGSV